jgi:hypothetical protein
MDARPRDTDITIFDQKTKRKKIWLYFFSILYIKTLDPYPDSKPDPYPDPDFT